MKNTNTYSSSILNAFQLMDINFLREHLKEEYSYQNAPKSIFLDEVEDLFKAHSNSTDTTLLLYTGKCKSSGCPNCDKKGYRFVGNVSRNYFSLIFDVQEDDIKDIYTCNDFATKEELKELGTDADIFIHQDELVTFIPTPEYLSKLNIALEAHDQIIQTPPAAVSLDFCNNWLDRYSGHYQVLDGDDVFAPRLKWARFTNLYEHIREWCEFTNTHIKTIQQANKTPVFSKDESSYISWVLEYEDVFEQFPLILKNATTEKSKIYAIELWKATALLTGKAFDEVFQFKETLNRCQTELLEKYGAYTYKEEQDIYYRYGDDAYQKLSSLKFNLDRRAEANSLGLEIPLYLNKPESE